MNCNSAARQTWWQRSRCHTARIKSARMSCLAAFNTFRWSLRFSVHAFSANNWRLRLFITCCFPPRVHRPGSLSLNQPTESMKARHCKTPLGGKFWFRPSIRDQCAYRNRAGCWVKWRLRQTTLSAACVHSTPTAI